MLALPLGFHPRMCGKALGLCVCCSTVFQDREDNLLCLCRAAQPHMDGIVGVLLVGVH